MSLSRLGYISNIYSIVLQGVTHLDALKVDGHTSYEHHSSVHEFQEAIAEVITDELVSNINQSPYFSVTLDESTDITNKQNLIVYVLFLKKEKGEMVPKTQFLGLITLKEGANADQIHTVLSAVLSRKGLDMSRLCGVATDGAAVMTGCKTGVVQKLKSEYSCLLFVHCIAHRLALASEGAADSIVYLVKFQEIVNSLYKLFEKSPRMLNKLDAMQEVLNQKQKLKLKQIFHTRWLSFDGALKALITNYSALLSVLHAEKSAKSAGLLKSMATYKFLYCAHFLSDVMNKLKNAKTMLKNVYDVMQYAISIKELYPNVADIAMRFLATPVSTVSCERGFSRHNAIKTKKRNCLSTATVECLMHISMQKPDNQFDYKSAFRKWVDVKKRRIL